MKSILSVCLLAVIFICINSCANKGPTGKPLVDINNFPDKGWRMFNTPRTSFSVGTVFAISNSGGLVDYGKLPGMITYKATDETLPTITMSIGKNLNSHGGGELLKYGIPASFNLNATTESDTQFTASWGDSTKRVTAPLPDLFPLIEKFWNTLPANAKNDGDFYVILATMEVNAISYDMNRNAVSNFGGEAQFDSLANANTTYRFERRNGYRLIKQFSPNQYIFYQPYHIQSIGATGLNINSITPVKDNELGDFKL